MAIGYSRVLKRRELRVADFGTYRLWVNVGEPLGIEPFFFGQSGAVWLTSLLIAEGDVCIDAGANVGHYTFLMASVVGKGGSVFAFEANPEMVVILGRSVALNDYGTRVEVVPRALWSVAGEEMAFFLSTESTNSGTSSLVDHGSFLSRDHTARVRTTTLDEFARERSLGSVRLVKLDVERAEDQVLRGTESLLRERRIDYLIVELNTHSEAERILEQHGYSGYLLDVAQQKLRALETVPAEIFCDALFVSPTIKHEFLQRFAHLLVPSQGH
ncbi:MAG TPA: FkbM family methyltransferase [Polyangiaceae bacterium]|nr:FkbM family methyltransferase [Polyangiaceae bacterium]